MPADPPSSDALIAHIEAVGARVSHEVRAALDVRLDALSARVDEVILRVDALNERVHEVNIRLDRSGQELVGLRAALVEAVDAVRAEVDEACDGFAEASALTARALRDLQG